MNGKINLEDGKGCSCAIGIGIILNLFIFAIAGCYNSSNAYLALQSFILLETGAVIAWYTSETHKLRLTSDKHLKLAYSPNFAIEDSSGAQHGTHIQVKMHLDYRGGDVAVTKLEANGQDDCKVEFPKQQHGTPIADVVLKINNVPRDTRDLPFTIVFRNSLGMIGKDNWIWKKAGESPEWISRTWIESKD